LKGLGSEIKQCRHTAPGESDSEKETGHLEREWITGRWEHKETSLTGKVLYNFALMMEAVRTSETSVSFYKTRSRNIPENGSLHFLRSENLKSSFVTV
jgi:hypothetical protein